MKNLHRYLRKILYLVSSPRI